MKKYFVFFAFALFSVSMVAQDMRDAVYMRNGSIIKGYVMEQVMGESIKIRTADGSLFVYPMDEVVKIMKETKDEYEKIYKPRTTEFKGGNGLNKGFRSMLELGYVDYYGGVVSANYSLGVQFNHYVFLGVGGGVRYSPDYETYSVPVYANFRVDFINAKVTPFLDIKAGYSPTGDVVGGFASAGVGCRFRLGKRFGLSLSAGYEAQGEDGYDDVESVPYARLGLEF